MENTNKVEIPLEPKWLLLLRQWAFIAVHFIGLAVVFVGFSWPGLITCLALYFIRMFAITGGYHRYFSHRTYQTSRVFQFLLAFLGATAVQKGAIWWAAHHRHHHKHSDTEEDIHSPKMHGIWHAHIGWVLDPRYSHTQNKYVGDLLKYPELVWLEKYNLLPPILLGFLVFLGGCWIETAHPEWNTNAWQFLVWGFFFSTVILYHGTFCINSFTHIIGKKRFESGDESRNSLIMALITMGEGWHNNHHRYPGSEKQGFYWWEIDITHYILKLLSWLGIVWDLRVPPARIYEEAKKNALKA
jgi:stearoyl-CoA desaturase (delta-9 desaturase)